MKTIQKLMFLSLMYLAMPSAGIAQPVRPTKSATPEKPFIFSRFPKEFECSFSSLRTIFNSQEKDQVTIPLTGRDHFTGTIISRMQPDSNIVSMNIMSTNYPGTMLNISLKTESDKTDVMEGIILNPKTGDALIIENKDGKYFVRKELSKLVIANCPLPQQINNEQ